MLGSPHGDEPVAASSSWAGAAPAAADDGDDASRELFPDARDSAAASPGGSGDADAATLLLGGWIECFSRRKSAPYWRNSATGETTWQKPGSVGWTEHWSSSRSRAYYRHASGFTTWQRPASLPPPPPPETTSNMYGDLQLQWQSLTPRAAPPALHAALSATTRGLWLTVPWAPAWAPLLSAALTAGLSLHGARGGVLTLQAWRAAGANPTPPVGHHACGAVALVVDGAGRLLAVRERTGRAGWHAPGGHVDAGEDALATAPREAREEAGARCAPLGVAALRETHHDEGSCADGERWAAAAPAERAAAAQATRFGTSILNYYVLCAVTRGGALAPDGAEVEEARWLTPEEHADAAPPHEAAIVRALRSGGQLAAAALLAAAAAALPDGDEDDGERTDARRLARAADASPAAAAAACAGLIAPVVVTTSAGKRAVVSTALGGAWLRAVTDVIVGEPPRVCALAEALRASCDGGGGGGGDAGGSGGGGGGGGGNGGQRSDGGGDGGKRSDGGGDGSQRSDGGDDGGKRSDGGRVSADDVASLSMRPSSHFVAAVALAVAVGIVAGAAAASVVLMRRR